MIFLISFCNLKEGSLLSRIEFGTLKVVVGQGRRLLLDPQFASKSDYKAADDLV